MNERDRSINHMMLEFAETVRLKGLRPSGVGGGLNYDTGKYKELGISFTMQEKVKDVAEARILFINTANAFISFINSREDIREYLDVFPVTILNIDLAILFSDSPPEDIVDVFNCGNRLCFYKECAKPQQEPWIKIHEETFEEAQAILSQTEN